MSKTTPRPPGHLRRESAAWWRQVVKAYDLDHHHLHLLRLACDALDRHAEAQELIARHGLVVVGASGSLKPNPASNIARDAAATFQRLIVQLEFDEEDVPPPPPASVRKWRKP